MSLAFGCLGEIGFEEKTKSLKVIGGSQCGERGVEHHAKPFVLVVQ